MGIHCYYCESEKVIAQVQTYGQCGDINIFVCKKHINTKDEDN